MTVTQAARKWKVAKSTVDTWVRKGRVNAAIVLGHYDIPANTRCPEKLSAGKKVTQCPECGSAIYQGRCTNPAKHNGGVL